MTKDTGREILLERETYDAASPQVQIEAEELEPLTVRGKSEPVEVIAI